MPRLAEGGKKSNPQSPVLFSPATENKPVVAVDQSLGIEEFEREIDNYIENLGSLGGPGVNRPPKSNTIGARALAGEIYPVENKDKRAPASDPKIMTRRAPVFPIYDFDRDYIEPTPSAMLGGGEGAGGARRKAPSMRRMLSGIPPCLHSRKTTLFREIPVKKSSQSQKMGESINLISTIR